MNAASIASPLVIDGRALAVNIAERCIDREGAAIAVDERCIDRESAAVDIDAGCIDRGSESCSVDECCINRDGYVSAIDGRDIDRQSTRSRRVAFTVGIDEDDIIFESFTPFMMWGLNDRRAVHHAVMPDDDSPPVSELNALARSCNGALHGFIRMARARNVCSIHTCVSERIVLLR